MKKKYLLSISFFAVLVFGLLTIEILYDLLLSLNFTELVVVVFFIISFIVFLKFYKDHVLKRKIIDEVAHEIESKCKEKNCDLSDIQKDILWPHIFDKKYEFISKKEKELDNENLSKN